jgi:CMP-N-acetylneuraminic acid synthetase
MLIALIPARSGSKRIPNKNIRELAGHPLMAYTIQVAKDSGLFGEHIYVSSDSDEYLEIAEKYGAQKIKRTDYNADDNSRDYSWINEAINHIGFRPPAVAVLRPTSPFRSRAMLQEAWKMMLNKRHGTGLKAISAVKEHPKKMWLMKGGENYMKPYDGDFHYEWCYPSNTLKDVFVQNAALDMFWTTNLCSTASMVGDYMGDKILPYITLDYEGFDINTEEDFWLAEILVEKNEARLPKMK